MTYRTKLVLVAAGSVIVTMGVVAMTSAMTSRSTAAAPGLD